MYAVIMTGGKQYKVTPGEVVRVETLDAKKGDTVEIKDVYMIADGDNISLGKPTLACMWRAWIGFNFSHSLGVVLFGIACTHWGDLLGLSDGALAQVGRFVPTLVGATYFVLAVRYWFRVPVIGIALGTLSLFVAGILG